MGDWRLRVKSGLSIYLGWRQLALQLTCVSQGKAQERRETKSQRFSSTRKRVNRWNDIWPWHAFAIFSSWSCPMPHRDPHNPVAGRPRQAAKFKRACRKEIPATQFDLWPTSARRASVRAEIRRPGSRSHDSFNLYTLLRLWVFIWLHR